MKKTLLLAGLFTLASLGRGDFTMSPDKLFAHFDNMQNKIQWRQDLHATVACIASGMVPEISVVFETVDSKSETAEIKNVLSVDGRYSGNDKKAFNEKMDFFSNFQSASLTMSESDSSCATFKRDRDLDVVRFNSLDLSGKPRMIVWINKDNGFTEMTAMFDDTGKLLSVEFFENLHTKKTVPVRKYERSEKKYTPESLRKEVVKRLDREYSIDRQVERAFELRAITNELLEACGEKPGNRGDSDHEKHEIDGLKGHKNASKKW